MSSPAVLADLRYHMDDLGISSTPLPVTLRQTRSPRRPKVLNLDLRSPEHHHHQRASPSPQRPRYLNLDRSSTSWSTSSASLSSWDAVRETRHNASPHHLSALSRELEQQRLLYAQFEQATCNAPSNVYQIPETPVFTRTSMQTPMSSRYETPSGSEVSVNRRFDLLTHQLQILENQRLELSRELHKLHEKPTDQEEVLDRLLTRFTFLRLQADDLARRTSDAIDLKKRPTIAKRPKSDAPRLTVKLRIPRINYPSTDSLEESFMSRSRGMDTSNSLELPMTSTDDIGGGLLTTRCLENSWQSDTPLSAKSSRETSTNSSFRPHSSDAYSSSLPEEEEGNLISNDNNHDMENSIFHDNLREEIVARGHPVTLYREEVYLGSDFCRGFLTKMGGRVKTWRRRFFLFDCNRRQLMYFVDDSESKKKGAIDFSNMSDVYVNNNPPRRFRSPNPKLTFCLDTTSRTFYFVADCSEIMRMWIDVLLTAVKPNDGRARP